MSLGRLGVKRIDGVNAPNVIHELYAVPLNTLTAGTINICNQGTDDVLISVAIGKYGSGVTIADYLVYNSLVNGKETVELTGIVVSTDEIVYVASSAGNVNFAIWGMEETTQANVVGGRVAALNIGSANTLYPGATTNNQPAILYKCESQIGGSFNLVICNRNQVPATAKVAYVDALATVVDNAIPQLNAEDWIEELNIPANMYFERTGIVIKEGHSLVVEANIENVNFVLTGVLE